jgi:hypothetical protein
MPRGDMANPNANNQKGGAGKGVNPACDGETYHGGLHCCHHTWFLTDKEDDHLIPAAVDTYYMKWRYYFQVSGVLVQQVSLVHTNTDYSLPTTRSTRHLLPRRPRRTSTCTTGSF